MATLSSPNITPTSLPSPARDSNDFLYSWKEMAVFLKCGVRTVQRWEKSEGLPVHRHRHWKRGTVYALKTEIQEWLKTRESQEPGNLPKSETVLALAYDAPALLDNNRLYTLCEQARSRALRARKHFDDVAIKARSAHPRR